MVLVAAHGQGCGQRVLVRRHFQPVMLGLSFLLMLIGMTAGAPLVFRLGVVMVIPGWDKGIQGMKVGGRRKLTIPAHLAYGDRGAGSAIAPGETLIFVVDLDEVR